MDQYDESRVTMDDKHVCIHVSSEEVFIPEDTSPIG